MNHRTIHFNQLPESIRRRIIRYCSKVEGGGPIYFESSDSKFKRIKDSGSFDIILGLVLIYYFDYQNNVGQKSDLIQYIFQLTEYIVPAFLIIEGLTNLWYSRIMSKCLPLSMGRYVFAQQLLILENEVIEIWPLENLKDIKLERLNQVTEIHFIFPDGQITFTINEYLKAKALIEILYLEFTHINFLIQEKEPKLQEEKSELISKDLAHYFNHIDPLFTAYSIEHWETLSSLAPHEPYGQYLAQPPGIVLKKRHLFSLISGISIGLLIFQEVNMLIVLYILASLFILKMVIP